MERWTSVVVISMLIALAFLDVSGSHNDETDSFINKVYSSVDYDCFYFFNSIDIDSMLYSVLSYTDSNNWRDEMSNVITRKIKDIFKTTDNMKDIQCGSEVLTESLNALVEPEVIKPEKTDQMSSSEEDISNEIATQAAYTAQENQEQIFEQSSVQTSDQQQTQEESIGQSDDNIQNAISGSEEDISPETATQMVYTAEENQEQIFEQSGLQTSDQQRTQEESISHSDDNIQSTNYANQDNQFYSETTFSSQDSQQNAQQTQVLLQTSTTPSPRSALAPQPTPSMPQGPDMNLLTTNLQRFISQSTNFQSVIGSSTYIQSLQTAFFSALSSYRVSTEAAQKIFSKISSQLRRDAYADSVVMAHEIASFLISIGAVQAGSETNESSNFYSKFNLKLQQTLQSISKETSTVKSSSASSATVSSAVTASSQSSQKKTQETQVVRQPSPAQPARPVPAPATSPQPARSPAPQPMPSMPQGPDMNLLTANLQRLISQSTNFQSVIRSSTYIQILQTAFFSALSSYRVSTQAAQKIFSKISSQLRRDAYADSVVMAHEIASFLISIGAVQAGSETNESSNFYSKFNLKLQQTLQSISKQTSTVKSSSASSATVSSAVTASPQSSQKKTQETQVVAQPSPAQHARPVPAQAPSPHPAPAPAPQPMSYMPQGPDMNLLTTNLQRLISQSTNFQSVIHSNTYIQIVQTAFSSALSACGVSMDAADRSFSKISSKLLQDMDEDSALLASVIASLLSPHVAVGSETEISSSFASKFNLILQEQLSFLSNPQSSSSSETSFASASAVSESVSSFEASQEESSSDFESSSAVSSSENDYFSSESGSEEVDSGVSSDDSFGGENNDESSSSDDAYGSEEASGLVSAAAGKRMDEFSQKLSGLTSGGNVDMNEFSEAFSNLIAGVSTDKSLSQSEAVVEALVECLVAVLNSISGVNKQAIAGTITKAMASALQ